MKKLLLVFALLLIPGFIWGCGYDFDPAQVVATTLPVYEFTNALCEGTNITVTRLITEEISCLHDYSLQTRQMRAVEGAQLVAISGGGLEAFLSDALFSAKNIIDASHNIQLDCHEGQHQEHSRHSHDVDPHFWLSPTHAKTMVDNICRGLIEYYPAQKELFLKNQAALIQKLDQLESYGKETLSQINCRELVSFHDGFTYFAQAFDLHILKAVEEESGSEASAAELIEIINIVNENKLPAIFTERSGSTSAASIIAAETGAKIYQLDMAMSGDSYFEAMYHNINTLKEALG